jgi:CRISPR-associated protein Csm1
MEDTVLKVAIAGFVHDIGKLADDCAMPVSAEYIRNNADLYQPFFQGHHSHRHALYTAAFIEHMEKLLPSKLNLAKWGLDDSFINLAAGHHKPETLMQWIIAIADRVSSGWDRVRFESEYNKAPTPAHYRRSRMLAIFENLLLDKVRAAPHEKGYAFAYPLTSVSPQSIFPGPMAQVIPTNEERAATEYRELFATFVSALDCLLHKEEDLSLWFEHFESLTMIFASCVPAGRAANTLPDVSLYDHLKCTSALATALYIYHQADNSMRVQAIKDYDAKKFLLISGNFYGIQSFVFSQGGETGRNRSKILRGRSFAVSLMSELAADMICRKVGIPSVCVLLNAAGRFTVIAPNTAHARVSVLTAQEEMNDWLMKISFGETSIGVSLLEASCEEFVAGKFIDLWDELSRRIEMKKYQKIDMARFGGVIEGYLDGFRNDLSRPLCPFCGKRPSSPAVEGSAIIGDAGSACLVCRDHVFLGTNLVKKTRIAITTSGADLRGDEKLVEPIFGQYQVAFVDGGMKELAKRGELLKYWDISGTSEGQVSKEVTTRFINGYVPVYRKEDQYDDRLLAGRRSDDKKEELIALMKERVPKTFSHLANKALNQLADGKGFCGLEALGVLKADVDHLGLLMSAGLGRERFTLSRLATMSRQMDWFFTLHLPDLLSSEPRFQDIYTVYAGGDDLFLMGPWNRIIELAGVLHEHFSSYVCRNPQVHLSAGITLHKPHIPLEKLAHQAETAIEKSKNGGRNRLTLFGETCEWVKFLELRGIRKILERWLDERLINNAMVYRLNDFIGMAEREQMVLQTAEVRQEDMDCLKWHALFHYTTGRNVANQLKGKENEPARRAMIAEFEQAAVWLQQYGGLFRMALWDVIYNRRKGA